MSVTSERQHQDLAAVTLGDLVAPLQVGEFVDRHWIANTPYHGRVGADLIRSILRIGGLDVPESLMAVHQRPVRVFGPGGERATVPADRGIEHLRRGWTLYADYVHRTVPAAHELMSGVAFDLGLEPWQLTLEAFAGVAGSTSTRHYDHDVTIQILLQGTKRWTFEPNDAISRPLQPFHPPVGSTNPLAEFGEEAYAVGPVTAPPAPDARAVVIEAHAGSAVFLPRGWWHTTDSLTDTWSFNVVFHSVTWARAFCRALEIRLHADPRFRDYCGGYAPLDRPRTALEDGLRAQTMAALRGEIGRHVETLAADEVALALLGFIGRTFRWTSSAEDRRLIRTPGGWHLTVGVDHVVRIEDDLVGSVTALCGLTSNFRWDHVPAVADHGTADRVYRVLADLVRAGAVEVVHPGLGG